METIGDFPALESIGEDLSILRNDALETIGDFSALTSIVGELIIVSNDKLQSLGDFSALTSIEGSLSIYSNAELQSLGNFSALTSIEGSLSIYSNAELQSLGNFSALTSIGKSSIHVPSEIAVIDNVSIVVENNPRLSDCYVLIDFLPGEVHVVSGGIYINNNALGCSSGDEIIEKATYTGDITVTTQAAVDALRTTLAGKTRIDGNVTIGYTSVSSRSDITNLSPLSNIVHITENLTIQQNESLVNLNGLTHLQSIGGGFYVFVNRSLTDLGNFPVLQSIGGYFRVQSNSELTDLGDFPVLQTIGGFFYVTHHSELTDLGDFPVLQSIGGFFSVWRNGELTDLGDFPDLQTIGGVFAVSSNSELTDLGDFLDLQTIGGYFSVRSNGELTNLGNLPALTSIGTGTIGIGGIPSVGDSSVDNVSIVIEDNSSLSDCYTLTDFLPGGVHAVSGGIYINDNALGCSSGGEIMASAPHTIMLTSHTEGYSIAIAYDEVTTQTIIFSIGGGATGWTSEITGDDFITLDTDMNVAQDTGVAITVTATPTENTRTDDRSATITFTTTGGTGAAASATVTITQEVSPDYIYVGDITVTTQTEVDSLRTTLAGKTRIDGNVFIGYGLADDTLRSDITDLTPLTGIVRITGSLDIQRNGQLDNLNGLTHLQTIGGHFNVYRNDSLPTLGNFPVLQTIGGNFYVGFNAQLTDLGDFPVLQSIGGYFDVRANSDLTDLGDFSILQTIGGYFSVSNNDTLTSLGNFPTLTSIGVGVTNRDSVSILVEDNSSLSDCYTLTDFLPGGTHAVSGGIYINNNAGVCTDQSALSNTIYRGNITVTTQAEVDTLRTTLAGKTRIDGNVTIGYTDDTSLSNITDLTPLSNIVRITGYVSISQNGQLVNLTDLTHLQTIGGYFYVESNNELTDLGDFPTLQTIGIFFSVRSNDILTTLGNFSALTSIGIGSTTVPSLGGFTTGVSIVIEDNSSLSDCYTLTDFLPGGAHAVSGEIYINNNALGCSSGDEIKTSAPHTIMLTSHTDGDSIAIAYNEVVTQTIMFSIGGGATGWTSAITGDDFITLDTDMNVAQDTVFFVIPHLASLDTDMNVAQDTGVAITVRATPTDENTGTDDRIATITFTTTGGGPAASATVTIRQAALPDYIYLGDITVTTQAEVDTLRTTLVGKTSIDGNLTIGYTSGRSRGDITDLTPLRNITDITGNLRIQRNGRLANLNALTHLQTIGGYFGVRNNSELTDLGDFPVLQTIGGYLQINFNYALETIGNFSALKSIGGYLNINNNGALETMGDFPALTSIGGYLYIAEKNDALETISDFPALTSIGGYVYIWNNGALETIGDFPALTSIGGYLRINSNYALETMGNFSALKSIGGYLDINNNGALETISDFTALKSIGEYLRITSNVTLETIDNFSALTSIGRSGVFVPSKRFRVLNVSIVVEGNTNLSVCCGLADFLPAQANAVSGRIFINDNSAGCNLATTGTDAAKAAALKAVCGTTTFTSQTQINDFDFANIIARNIVIGPSLSDNDPITDISRLSTITPLLSLTITENTELENLNGLSNLTRISGSLEVRNNSKLQSLGDFSTLTRIGGELNINNNEKLQSLGNFPALTSIGEFFNVSFQTQLTTLGDFSILQSIGGYFSVTNNDTLTSLGNFPSLTSIGVGVTNRSNVSIQVENNPSLSDCYTLTDFLPGGTHAVSGEIYINNNAGVCTDQSALSNTTYRGDITVTTQAAVDALATTLAGKTRINGNVTIGTTGSSLSGITDLSPLSNIVRITGNLRIQSNGRLANLNALTHLQTIGGVFAVSSNSELTDLDNFPVLQSIGGYFYVSGNRKLTDLGDFSVLQTIGGYFYVSGNRKLTDLGDFSVLQTIGGYFYVNNNDKLTDLGDFPVLRTVGEYFNVTNNDTLTDLGDFPVLRTVGEYFNVTNNDTLTTLGKFPALTSIGTGSTNRGSNISIQIESNSSLSDCYTLTDFLPGGTYAVSGGIYINDNAGVCTDQNALSNTIYRGDITVTTQAEVDTLRTTLAGKTRIVGNVTIGYTGGSSRSNITDLTPLRNIVRITGNLIIQQNGQLVNLNDLNNLQFK